MLREPYTRYVFHAINYTWCLHAYQAPLISNDIKNQSALKIQYSKKSQVFSSDDTFKKIFLQEQVDFQESFLSQ